MTDKIKKPLWKRWWVWVIAIIVIIAIANSGKESTPSSTPPAAPQAPAAPTPPPAPEPPKNKPGISKAEFDQIQNGMTLEQVVEIIGSNGEMLSEVGTKGDAMHTVVYMWKGESGVGANANFTFQDNKLQAKAQFGLK